MVLEFCNRGTLSDAIQRGWLLMVHDGAPQPGHVDMLRALQTAREVAGALEYLHSQNILHGDLNGNNIMLAGAPVALDKYDKRGFTAKVADFGLSRILMPGRWLLVSIALLVGAFKEGPCCRVNVKDSNYFRLSQAMYHLVKVPLIM